MNFNEFIKFVTANYDKPFIASEDKFTPEGSKVYKAHTCYGLVSYNQKSSVVTLHVNGQIASEYPYPATK